MVNYLEDGYSSLIGNIVLYVPKYRAL